MRFFICFLSILLTINLTARAMGNSVISDPQDSAQYPNPALTAIRCIDALISDPDKQLTNSELADCADCFDKEPFRSEFINQCISWEDSFEWSGEDNSKGVLYEIFKKAANFRSDHSGPKLSQKDLYKFQFDMLTQWEKIGKTPCYRDMLVWFGNNAQFYGLKSSEQYPQSRIDEMKDRYQHYALVSSIDYCVYHLDDPFGTSGVMYSPSPRNNGVSCGFLFNLASGCLYDVAQGAATMDEYEQIRDLLLKNIPTLPILSDRDLSRSFTKLKDEFEELERNYGILKNSAGELMMLKPNYYKVVKSEKQLDDDLFLLLLMGLGL